MAQQEPWKELPIAQTPATPDFYVDAVGFAASPYTVSLAIGVAQPVGDMRLSATIRMSHTHAKVFAIALKRFLKMTEAQLQAPIAVPQRVIEETGISLDEDW